MELGPNIDPVELKRVFDKNRENARNKPLSEKSDIDLWASFLANEKLEPERMEYEEEIEDMIRLAQTLAGLRSPKVRPHKERQACRRLVAATAIDLGIDLTAIKVRGKVLMARSLLDAWNEVCTKRFGSIYGSAGYFEAKRRDIKTRLAKRRQEKSKGV